MNIITLVAITIILLFGNKEITEIIKRIIEANTKKKNTNMKYVRWWLICLGLFCLTITFFEAYNIYIS